MSMYAGNQKVKPYVVGDAGIKYIWDENFDFSQPIDVTGYKKFSVNGGLIDDGHSRIWVDMSDENDLAITVKFYSSGTHPIIDWGDGNIETFSDSSFTRSHTYEQIGKYIIDIISNNSLGQYMVNQQSDTTMRNKVIYTEINSTISFSSLSSSLFRYLTSLKNVKFGSNFKFSQNTIPGYNCSGCTSLENFDFPDATSTIDIYAFQNCSSLKLTKLPDSITAINNYAFQNCTSLALTKLPDSITQINVGAFYGCSSLALTSLPSGLTTLGDLAFRGCTSLKLTSLPETITSYGGSIFYGCDSLTTMTLPDSMTTLPGGIFNNCANLTTINFPSNLTNISNSAFNGCSNLVLTSLPDTITIIDNSGFASCSKITLTTLPSALTALGQQAFNKCTSLTQITIPAAIQSISQSVFNGCTKLTSVTILATTPPTLTSSSAFPKTNTGFKIYVPAASLDTYKSATNWSELASYMEAIPS